MMIIVSRAPRVLPKLNNYHQRNFLGPLKFSNKLYGRYNSFVNSANIGTTNEEFSFQYGISTLVSAPLYKNDKGMLSSLGPNFLISFNGQENHILGDYFIGNEALTWGNIFDGKKIKSLTESDLGFSLALGVERQVIWEDGRHLEISIAASKIEDLTYNPSTIMGLESRRFNYLGKFSYQTKHANKFTANALFASSGHLLQGDVRGNYAHKKLNLGINYQTIDEGADERLSEDLRTMNLSSLYNLTEALQLNVSTRYDLINQKMATASFGLNFDLGSWEYNFNQEYLKQDPHKFSMSAIFDDECTRFTFSFENRYQDVGSSKPIKSLMFRVQLKPFANVVFLKEVIRSPFRKF